MYQKNVKRAKGWVEIIKTAGDCRGISIVELLIVLALLVVVLGVGYSFYYFGTSSFSIGESQSIIQQETMLAADFITSQVRYATEVEILDDNNVIPETVTGQDNYIFVNNHGLIEFRHPCR